MSKFNEEERVLISNQAGELLWEKVELAQHNDHHEIVRTQIGGKPVCISTAFLSQSHNEIPCELLRQLLPKGPCAIYQITVTAPEYRGTGLFSSHARILTDWLHAFRAKTFAIVWQYPQGEIPGRKLLESLGYELKPAAAERNQACKATTYCPVRIPQGCQCHLRIMEYNPRKT